MADLGWTPESLIEWLASLDAPGNPQRRTVSLKQIIELAKQAQSRQPETPTWTPATFMDWLAERAKRAHNTPTDGPSFEVVRTAGELHTLMALAISASQTVDGARGPAVPSYVHGIAQALMWAGGFVSRTGESLSLDLLEVRMATFMIGEGPKLWGGPDQGEREGDSDAVPAQ